MKPCSEAADVSMVSGGLGAWSLQLFVCPTSWCELSKFQWISSGDCGTRQTCCDVRSASKSRESGMPNLSEQMVRFGAIA